MPKRVQMSRQHPWRAEHPDAVIVARPSKWGNPFWVTENGEVAGQRWLNILANFGLAVMREQEAIYPQNDLAPSVTPVEYSIYWFRGTLDGLAERFPSRFEDYIAPLRGKDLACWCPLDQPCHADVLLEIANGGDR